MVEIIPIIKWFAFSLYSRVTIIHYRRSNWNIVESGVKHHSPPPHYKQGRRHRDRMVFGFTSTYAINAYHH